MSHFKFAIFRLEASIDLDLVLLEGVKSRG
jgi:hypothetical protein